MIILVRSNDINPDPRLQKYIDFLQIKKEPYLVLGWNRSKVKIEKPYHEYLHLEAKYGARYLNIKNKLRWFLFVFQYLMKNKDKYSIIHACDFDTALPVYLSKLFTKKKMIFDVFDWMSSIKNKSFIYQLIGILERKIFADSDFSIICDLERRRQIPVPKDNVLVLPNIPSIDFVEISYIKEIIKEQENSHEIILSYVGILDIDRGLEDLLEVISDNTHIFLNIAGFGRLEEKIKKFASRYKNMRFWGKVDYNTGLNIMRNSDLIVAMYYKTNPIHEFAAPNKYYEGLYLGVPIITTKKTLVGDKTEKYNTGFSIKEGKENIEELLTSDVKQKIELKKTNSKNLWFQKYQNYTRDFMEKEYYPLVK